MKPLRVSQREPFKTTGLTESTNLSSQSWNWWSCWELPPIISIHKQLADLSQKINADISPVYTSRKIKEDKPPHETSILYPNNKYWFHRRWCKLHNHNSLDALTECCELSKNNSSFPHTYFFIICHWFFGYQWKFYTSVVRVH